MNSKKLRNRLLRQIARLGSAGCLLAATPFTAFSQTQAVTGFDDNGWNADDVRNAAGTNITNPNSHAPAPGATSDSATVAQQIDWLNTAVSFGNLGGVRFDPTANVAGKATLSKVDTTVGFGVLGAVTADENFGVTYVWNRDNNVTPGVALRIGVQTAHYAAAQTDFVAPRSGEATWDLVLVYDPSNNGNTSGTRPSASVIDLENGKFNLFAQANNNYWAETADTQADALGVGSLKSRTLSEWLADDYWGPLLQASLITNTQFGMGSGNAGGLATLDWAEISFLNDGDRIDFVEAARYTGGGANPAAYGDSANWDGVTPSSTQNLVVEGDADLVISGTQHTRSLGILGGTTHLVLQAADSILVLNSAENGTLSAAPDATLNVSGAGELQASVIEVAGIANISVTTTLDGGDEGHPVRDGGPAAASRYGLVIQQGGIVNLLDGAKVKMVNETGANGIKTLIRVGELSTVDAPGVLHIAPGASLDGGSLHGSGSWSALHVGDWGGQGVVNQTGGSVKLFGAIVIGNEEGVGTYNLVDGTIDILRPVADNAAVIIGRATGNRAAEGTLNVSGGTLTLGADGGAPGNVAMVLGGLSDNVAGYANAKGTVNQTDGVVSFKNAVLKFGRGTGAYNLDGGVMEIGGANAITATTGGVYSFNLGGGTLRVINSNLTTSIAINVVDTNPKPGTGAANVSTSVIDTNGRNATFSGALTGEGYLVKTGLGTLFLSGANNLAGQFYVTGGATHQTGGESTIHYFAVGSGEGASGEFAMSGGSLTITQALQVGDYGGEGVFTQTAGDVVVGPLVGASFNVGNQGGNGVYNLSGGSFTIVNGFANLGRSTQTEVAGDGTLNLSGTGLFHVGDGGDLIIGDRDPAGLEGNGVVNQTGGVLRVTGGGQLWVGAYGNGEYNLLSGGVLEIGGSQSLNANYGSGTGTSAFNLGGGTVRVIDANLATDIRTTLLAATTSTIDTNALDASFGRFTGPGSLVKTGLGAFRATSADIGDFVAEAGHSEFAEASSFTSITVHVDATFSALDGLSLDGGPVTLGFTNLSEHAYLTLGGVVDLNGTLVIDLVEPFSFTLGDTLHVFHYDNLESIDLSGFALSTLPTLGAGLYWDAGSLASTGSITVAAVPEPSAFAALAGLGALGFAACRRRKRPV